MGKNEWRQTRRCNVLSLSAQSTKGQQICANVLLLGLLCDVLDKAVIEMYSGGCTRSLFSLRSQCCRDHVTRDRFLSIMRLDQDNNNELGIITLFVIFMFYVSESGLVVVSIRTTRYVTAFALSQHMRSLRTARDCWEARLLYRLF